MNHRRRIRPHLAYLDEVGVKVDDVGISGRSHFKLDVTFQGNSRQFTCAYSPSDRRSFLNWKADIRRWLNQLGEHHVQN